MPEKWKPSYDTYKQSLVDILVRAGVIYPPTVTNGSDRPELLKARTQHNDLVEQIRSAETRKEDTEQQLDKDWGRDWEWKKLEGTCVEQNTGECVFFVVPAPAAKLLRCCRQADWFCIHLGTHTACASLAKRLKSPTTTMLVPVSDTSRAGAPTALNRERTSTTSVSCTRTARDAGTAHRGVRRWASSLLSGKKPTLT